MAKKTYLIIPQCSGFSHDCQDCSYVYPYTLKEKSEPTLPPCNNRKCLNGQDKTISITYSISVPEDIQ